MTLTLTDFFAGGGGTSEGARRVPGLRLAWAANHWPTAVATHSANHPGAEHLCADLSQLDPRATPRTDLAWLSPSCTFHSSAQGSYRDTEAAKMSRATMWCAPAFAERHGYDAVVVENVLEVTRWVLWPAWQQAMRDLGYTVQVMSLNAAHTGSRVPQSRDRLFVIASRVPLDVSALTEAETHCPTCGPVRGTRAGRLGRYGRQYRYLCPECLHDTTPTVTPAAAIIDDTDRGTPVAGRYADRTRWKINLGIERFDGAPFVAELRGGGSTVRPLTEPLSTVTAGGRHHLLVWPDGPDVDDASARMASTRELARAQGFPDTYEWVGTDADVARQIGNAVATTTAEATLRTVVDTLTLAA